MFLFVNLIIYIGHWIGSVTYGPLFNVEPLHRSDFYTWKTCIAGYVMYLIISAFGLMVWAIYGIYKCIVWKYTYIDYGTDVNENTYMLG
jgi:hypothetical protein